MPRPSLTSSATARTASPDSRAKSAAKDVGKSVAKKKVAIEKRGDGSRAEDRAIESLLAALGEERDLTALLNRVVSAACRLLRADHGTIGLVDDDERSVRTEGHFNMPASEINARMPPGIGLAGEVLRVKRAVAFSRYGDVPNPTQGAMHENSVLGMPIIWRQQMIGVFGIGRAPHRRAKAIPFSTQDKATLKTFARYAAIAINTARQHQAEQERAERFALVLRVGRIVTADLRLDELLQRAADAVHEVLGYPNTAIPLVDANDPETLILRVTGGSYKHIVHGEYRQSIRDGIMGEAVVHRRPILANDVANDPRYIPVPGSHGIVAELAVPIMLGEQCLGVLNVESDTRLSARDVEALRIVADQLAVAIDNARLHASAQNLAAVEERHRLARDLHDSVTQLLFSITLVAQSLEPAWRRDPDEGARRGTRLLELSQQALAEMRALLTELRSAEDATMQFRSTKPSRSIAVVRERGLFVAVRQLSKRLSKDGIDVRVRTTGSEPDEAELTDAVYRIAQEAMYNVTKHAKARSVQITLDVGEDNAKLVVDDDGVGLARSRRGRLGSGGMGVTFMKERAEVLGGSVELVRSPGTGNTRACNNSSFETIDMTKTIRVVIADDHHVVREGLRLILAEADGIEVIGEASDGEEAVRLATERTPDVVLMDLMMPKLDGIGAAKQLVANKSPSRVLILTSSPAAERVGEAVRAGVSGYLMKDILSTDLIAAIRNAAAGIPTLHPHAQRQLMLEVSAPVERSPLETLTPRERDVLRLIVDGLGNKQIAARLGLSAGTVKGYVSEIFQKVGVTDRTQAALLAVRHGMKTSGT